MRDLNQEGSTQPEQVRKDIQGSQIAFQIHPRDSKNLLIPSSRPIKSGPGAKAKGDTKRDFGRRQTSNKPTSGKSSGSIFAESLSMDHSLRRNQEISISLKHLHFDVKQNLIIRDLLDTRSQENLNLWKHYLRLLVKSRASINKTLILHLFLRGLIPRIMIKQNLYN